jgi:dehydrogenase/reductase SDR family protein 1
MIGGIGIAHKCDHRNDENVKELFERVIREQGKIDILVNNVWAGYEHIPKGYFFETPFWKQPISLWDDSFDVGLRSHYVASKLAAQSMVEHRSGLIVNISFYSGRKYMNNVTYGVCKAALDRLSKDMSYELKEYGVPVFSLYPGLVRTETILEAAKYDNNLNINDSESPQFIGRCIAALSQDKNIIKKTGEILISAEIAQEYNITDINGKIPKSHRDELW